MIGMAFAIVWKLQTERLRVVAAVRNLVNGHEVSRSVVFDPGRQADLCFDDGSFSRQ